MKLQFWCAQIKFPKKIQCIALSNDNSTIAVISDTGITELYDFFTFQKKETLEKVDGWGRISFSPDDKLLLVGTWVGGYVFEIDK